MQVGDLVVLYMPFSSKKRVLDTGIVEQIGLEDNKVAVNCCKLGRQEVQLDNMWLEVISESD